MPLTITLQDLLSVKISRTAFNVIVFDPKDNFKQSNLRTFN
jgi:hypothetical protein